MMLQASAPRYASALIVDSDSISVKIVERALRAMSVLRIATADSLHAAAACLVAKPDLLITEVVVAREVCFPLLQTLVGSKEPPIIVGMSRTASRTQVFRLSAYGVSAFLEKPLSSTGLCRAIHSAERVAPRDWQGIAPQGWNPALLEQFIQGCRRTWRLTGTEQEILRYSCAGMSRQEIAAERGISINTVKTHVRSILNKAGVGSMRLLLRQVPPFGGYGVTSRELTMQPEVRA